MGQVICSCENPTFPRLGRPNCVIEMRAVAFAIFVPRFKADGSRNTIDLTDPNLGQTIQGLISASNDTLERLYPSPRFENVTFERTETVFETAPSTRKYKIPGVGGVRTVRAEMWSKDAVHAILRELKSIGCSDVDVYFATVDGNLWGILDDVNNPELRGYEMATETFDAFKDYATDTTTQKIMVSWDFDNAECEENAYAITSEELVATGGVKATKLEALIAGYTSATALTTTTAEVKVKTTFGSAVNAGSVVGLVSLNFQANNLTTPGAVAVTSAPGAEDGEYVLTFAAQTLNDVIQVDVINAGGYDIASTTFVAL